MTEIIVSKEDLEKYSLYFGARIEELFQECVGDVTNREASRAFGYLANLNPTQARTLLRNKRVRASRFKLMCTNRNKDPNQLISKYQPKVIQIFSSVYRGCNRSKEVEEPLREAVYKALCDGA